ncbi:MAG: hypothetical protein AAF571_10920 [Verrucomicrobiota bacterium]
MKKLSILIALSLQTLTSVCLAENTDSLKFYIVEPDSKPGLTKVDFMHLDCTGWIHTEADLSMPQIDRAYVTPPGKQWTHRDSKLNIIERGETTYWGLNITFTKENVTAFERLTEKAVGRKVLIMLGDTPLLAATVIRPISSRFIELTLKSESLANSAEKRLKAISKKQTP